MSKEKLNSYLIKLIWLPTEEKFVSKAERYFAGKGRHQTIDVFFLLFSVCARLKLCVC